MNTSDYNKIAWHNANRSLSVLMRERLKTMQLWDDVKQEIALVVWQSQAQNLSLRDTSNLTKRVVYRALSNMGLRKRAGYRMDSSLPINDLIPYVSQTSMSNRTCPGFERDQHEADESEFYQDANRRGGGFSRLCKDCHKARSRKYFKSKYYPENAQELKDAVKRRRADAKST